MVLEKLKYISNVSQDGIVTMLLYSRIGDKLDAKGNLIEQGIKGDAFANEMLYCAEYLKPKQINVRINSIGGNVFEGYSIVSAILNCPIPVNTYIDGLAASMAGVIAVAGKKCFMADYGTLMLHNPAGDGDAEVINLIKNTLVTIFEKRRGLDAEKISNTMQKETWYNCKQAKAEGFIDEVIASNKTLNTNTNNLSELLLIYNEVLNPKKMSDKINKLLKLQNEASEEAQAEAIKALQEELAAANTAKEAAEAAKKVAEDKLAEIETAKEAEKNTAAEGAVENAIKKGIFKTEDKTKMLTLAKTDINAFNNLVELAGDKGKAHKIFDASKAVVAENAARKNWTIRDWEKNAPKELERMYVENRTQYDQMFNEFYKK